MGSFTAWYTCMCLSEIHWSLSRQFIQEHRTNTGTSVQRVSQRAYLISMSLFSGKWTTLHINCVIREPDILFPLLLVLRQMGQSCDDALHIGQCSMKNITKSIFRNDSTSERQSQVTSYSEKHNKGTPAGYMYQSIVDVQHNYLPSEHKH